MVVIVLSSQEINRFSQPASSLHNRESSASTVFARIAYRESSRESRLDPRFSILARIENRVSTYIWAVLYVCARKEVGPVHKYPFSFAKTVFQIFKMSCCQKFAFSSDTCTCGTEKNEFSNKNGWQRIRVDEASVKFHFFVVIICFVTSSSCLFVLD